MENFKEKMQKVWYGHLQPMGIYEVALDGPKEAIRLPSSV